MPWYIRIVLEILLTHTLPMIRIAFWRLSVAEERPRSEGAALGLMARVLQLLVHEPTLVERLPAVEEWGPEDGAEAVRCRQRVRLLRAGR